MARLGSCLFFCESQPILCIVFDDMKKFQAIFFLNMIVPLSMALAQTVNLVPLTARVNIQDELAPNEAVVDGQWVAVGTNKPHALQYDYSRLWQGKPSFRFNLKEDDNTLEGYSEGETKGRAELSYCYATADVVSKLTKEELDLAVVSKMVYHYGKGACKQGSTKYYRFSVFISDSLASDVSTIFAQWHGMPDRTLVTTPEGITKKISRQEFAKLCETMLFKKDKGHEKVMLTDNKGNPKKDKSGNPMYKAGQPNGWLVEQGGYPPLAFGFSDGFFYVKANSDRKWMSDKTDRCNINAAKAVVMKPQTSTYKSSTIAAKMPFAEFPKNQWVTFTIMVEWSAYGVEKETVEKDGRLDVKMDYSKDGKAFCNHLVSNQSVLIGRNDDDGYYFKFGIYRVGNSSVPVCYNLAGYSEGDSISELKPIN